MKRLKTLAGLSNVSERFLFMVLIIMDKKTKEEIQKYNRKKARQRRHVLSKIFEKGAIEINGLAKEFRYDHQYFYTIVSDLMVRNKVYVPEWTSPIRVVSPNKKEEKFNALVLHKRLLARRHRIQAAWFRGEKGNDSHDAAIQEGFADQLDRDIKQLLSRKDEYLQDEIYGCEC